MKKTYLDIRNSVVEQIQAAFANDKRVKVAAHPGNFDEGEIRRLMQTTPAILTSLVGINDEDVADECYIDFVSWVLHRADNKDRLYDGGFKREQCMTAASPYPTIWTGLKDTTAVWL